MAYVVHHSFGFLNIYKSAGYHVGARNYRMSHAVDRYGNDNNTVICQMLSVTQNYAADIADSESVNQYSARLNGFGGFNALICNLNNAAKSRLLKYYPRVCPCAQAPHALQGASARRAGE